MGTLEVSWDFKALPRSSLLSYSVTCNPANALEAATAKISVGNVHRDTNSIELRGLDLETTFYDRCCVTAHQNDSDSVVCTGRIVTGAESGVMIVLIGSVLGALAVVLGITCLVAGLLAVCCKRRRYI